MYAFKQPLTSIVAEMSTWQFVSIKIVNKAMGFKKIEDE